MGEQSLVDGIEALLSTEPGVVTYRSKDTYLEIANSACSKGLGVEAAAEELGYHRGDCYFFGDNYNDIPAFAAVGTSIAVANGKQAVLDAATITTSRHHDDGVAAYLEAWLAGDLKRVKGSPSTDPECPTRSVDNSLRYEMFGDFFGFPAGVGQDRSGGARQVDLNCWVMSPAVYVSTTIGPFVSVPAGWYTDPQDSALVRYWDGMRWTDHVQLGQPAQSAPLQSAPQVPLQAQQQFEQGQEPNQGRAGGMRKVGFFGAKKTAETALADVERLQRILDERGLLEFDQIEASRDELRRTAENERREWASEKQQLQLQLHALRSELTEAEGQLVTARASAALQEVGVFDFDHPAEHSAHLAARLDSVRAQYKEMARGKQAIHATSNFTFNNSAKQGMKFVNQMSTIMLRAYNAEAENCVKTVKAGSLATATARLTKAKEQIERQGTMINLRVDETYHHLRIQEMVLAAEHLQALAAEKELERARREDLREQKKTEAELAAARQKLAKERAMHQATLDALIANGDIEGAERMRAKIAEDELALADVERRAANIRAGYVYVISNIGAFGENMVKIGMTRRLEPMDRVNELGDASVPFRFDVHALFYSDDALATEAMLHRTFAEQRVNKVNLRREFFRVTPRQVLEVLKEHHVELVEFTEQPTAEEFRLSTAEAEALPV